MNSLPDDSSGRYSILSSSSTQNLSCESLPLSEATNSRYCYDDSFATLTQVDLQHSQPNLSHFDDRLSYLSDEYFQSSSFNPFMTNLQTVPTVVSNPQNRPTYASLMPAHHQMSMNCNSFQTTLPGTQSTASDGCVNTFSLNDNLKTLPSVIGRLTKTLPELKMSPHNPDLLNGGYLTPQDHNLHFSSHMLHASGRNSLDCKNRSLPTNNNLLSPAYSKSPAATPGSNEKSILAFSAEEKLPANIYKSRSKKESHNRIERRRRDYINSQIIHLGNLIPAEMYRDGDGRRNKGTVLRLSVKYITELRHALSQSSGIHRETNLARLLIPQLLNRINILESIVREISTQNNGSINSASESYESQLDVWKSMVETNMNLTSVSSSNAFKEMSPQSAQNKCIRRGRTHVGASHGSTSDFRNSPLLENTQASFTSLPSMILSTQHQNSTDFMPTVQDHVFLGASLKPEDLDGDNMYSLACDDAILQNKQRTLGGKFDDFQHKSDDAGEDFFDSCESTTFDDLMQMNTDGVESLQPIECRNH